MKKNIILCGVLILLSSLSQAQNVYTTSGGELMFSFINGEYQTSDGATVGADGKLRFAPVINYYQTLHYDISTNLGFTLGLGVHNVGFISDVPGSIQDEVNEESDYHYTGEVSKRFRNYSLAVPVGFKLGIMEHTYLYGGYEIEFPFLYKEKTYEDGEKVRKYTKWFSDETPVIYNSLFVGVQLPRGFNVKFQYYLSDFFDQDYVQQKDNWTGARNYYPTKANVFYFTLSKTLFKGREFMYYDKNPQKAPGHMAMY